MSEGQTTPAPKDRKQDTQPAKPPAPSDASSSQAAHARGAWQRPVGRGMTADAPPRRSRPAGRRTASVGSPERPVAGWLPRCMTLVELGECTRSVRGGGLSVLGVPVRTGRGSCAFGFVRLRRDDPAVAQIV